MRARLSVSSSFLLAALFVLMLPLVADAGGNIAQSAQNGIFGLLTLAARVLNTLVGLFVLGAIVVFFWGLIQYLRKVDEEKSKGLQTMIWGIVAIFVMVSIWGLIRIVQQTFGLDSAAANQAILPAGITPINTR